MSGPTADGGGENSKLFVLVDCVDGESVATMDEIRKISHVTDIKETVGPYHIIVTLESESNEELKETLDRIRKITTIRSTLTLRASHDLEVLS